MLITSQNNITNYVTNNIASSLSNIGWNELYENFSKISIRRVHPFALLEQSLNNNENPSDELIKNTFPSISVEHIEDNEDNKVMSGMIEEGLVTSDLLNTWRNNSISNNNKKETDLNKVILVDPSKLTDNLMDRTYYKHHFINGIILNLEIWSENPKITRNISTITTHDILTNANKILDNAVLNEMHDSLFNMNYGRILYGSKVTIKGFYTKEVYKINTEELITIDSNRVTIEVM